MEHLDSPILARLDFSKTFTIHADSSEYVVGVVLTQEYEDGKHTIVYGGIVLIPAEKNYWTTDGDMPSCLLSENFAVI